MKKINVITKLIALVVITLSILNLSNIINYKHTQLIKPFLLGILLISQGYSSYYKDKKGEAIFLILSSLFIIFVSTYTTFF